MSAPGWLRSLTTNPRRWSVAAVVVFAALAALASRVQMDPSVERMHPRGGEVRETFARYQAAFPRQDSLVAIVIDGPALLTPLGAERVRQFEEALRRSPHVAKVTGPASVRLADGAPLLPEGRDTDALRGRLAEARRSRALSRSIVHPQQALLFIRAELKAATGQALVQRDTAFAAEAATLAQTLSGEGLRFLPSGAPVMRGRISQLLERDMGRLLPAALLLALVLVGVWRRSVRAAVAATLTVVFAATALTATMALLGLPFGLLASFAPIVVLVVSLSDTVHILETEAELRSTVPEVARRVAEAAWRCAGPCLATEIAIAAGFLAMSFIDIRAVAEFGWICALGVLLAFVANMTALPILMALIPAKGTALERSAGPFHRAVEWVATQVIQRRGRVVLALTVFFGVAALFATRVRVDYRIFDDLTPGSALWEDLRRAEAAGGGVVPVALFIEVTEGTVLDPAALGFMARAEQRLRALPQAPLVLGLPSLLFAVEDGTAASTEALLARLDAYVPTDQLVTADRRSAAVLALLPDLGADELSAVVSDLQRFIEERAPEGMKVSVTGNVAMTDYVTSRLTRGLLLSLGSAVLTSLLFFALVLRSVRLALVGLVPNLLPQLVLFGAMGLLGITLKPSTVLIAAMALAVADDDTLQYLARYRRERARLPSGSDEGGLALSVLRSSGPPMLMTTLAVGIGFAVLLFSSFRGVAHLGALTSITLVFAGITDLFVLPLLLSWRRRP